MLLCMGLVGQNAPAGSAPAPTVVPAAEPPGPNAIPQAVDAKTFQLGTQDVIRVRVYQDPSLNQETVILPDGTFSMPLIGMVHAEGLTPQRLEAQLEEALAEFVNMPDVQVSVLQVNSKSFRVSGMVMRAGVFPLVKPITIFQALTDAGFQQYANKKKVLIMRNGKPGAKPVYFNYEDYMKGKNLDKNPDFLIETGDIIIVNE